MSIQLIKREQQADGNFNNGEILEKKPIGFPQDGGITKPYSNLFYWAHAWKTEKKSTMVVETHTTYNNEVKEGEEVDVFLSYFDHDKKRLHYKLEMYEKNKNVLSATTEVLSLYIDLNLRKVAEFEEEKIKIMDQFIKENKSKFKIDNLQFSNKLKK